MLARSESISILHWQLFLSNGFSGLTLPLVPILPTRELKFGENHVKTGLGEPFQRQISW
jgi:hypothetical protein